MVNRGKRPFVHRSSSRIHHFLNHGTHAPDLLERLARVGDVRAAGADGPGGGVRRVPALEPLAAGQACRAVRPDVGARAARAQARRRAATVVALDADFGTAIMRGRFYLYFQSFVVDLFGALVMVGVLLAAARRYLRRPRKLVYTDEAAL